MYIYFCSQPGYLPDQEVAQLRSGSVCCDLWEAVNNHWTGLLDWTTHGLDYWTDQFYHKIHTCGLKTPAFLELSLNS